MSGPPLPPSLRDLFAAFASGDVRAQVAAFAIRPPDNIDPADVKAVQDAARAAEAARRGGIDVKT